MRIEQKLLFPLIIIVSGNILTCIVNKFELSQYLIYILPILIFELFLIISLVISHNKNNTEYVLSWFLLFVSTTCAILDNPSALNDINFLCISLFLKKNKNKNYVLYFLLYSIVIIARYTIQGLSVSQLAVHLAGCSIVFIIYDHFILKEKAIKEEIKSDYLISPVKKDVVDTIRLIISGYGYHEINDKLELNITADRVRRNVNAEVKRLHFRNREHMIFFLTGNGIIKSISYDLGTGS